MLNMMFRHALRQTLELALDVRSFEAQPEENILSFTAGGELARRSTSAQQQKLR